jgi:hypothetical protein
MSMRSRSRLRSWMWLGAADSARDDSGLTITEWNYVTRRPGPGRRPTATAARAWWPVPGRRHVQHHRHRRHCLVWHPELLPTDERDPVQDGLAGVEIGLLAAIALGVLAATGEYRTGMIRTTLALCRAAAGCWRPRRWSPTESYSQPALSRPRSLSPSLNRSCRRAGCGRRHTRVPVAGRARGAARGDRHRILALLAVVGLAVGVM